MVEKQNIENSLSRISTYWNPHIIAELNGQEVKLAKLKGEFVWHKHDDEDEMFFVVSGVLDIELRGKVLTLKEGEIVVIPKGVEHRPVAKDEVSVMLFEPASTLNTGDAGGKLTQYNLKRL